MVDIIKLIKKQSLLVMDGKQMTSRMTKEDSKFISVFEPTVTLKDKVSVLKSLNKKDISGSINNSRI